jgi:putative polyhydroxyalkanoate system protein
MADISLSRDHTFGLDGAKEKLETLLAGFKERKPDLVSDVAWNGNTATASGKFFKGAFTVTDTNVNVDVELIGFAAKMAKGMVRDQLTKQLDREFPA